MRDAVQAQRHHLEFEFLLVQRPGVGLHAQHQTRGPQRHARGGGEDLAVGVGRGNVGDLRNGRDHRALERKLRVLGVADGIETIGNLARLERLAVARRQCRAELGLVGIGSFVQVDMQEHALTHGRDQAHQRCRFLGRTVLAKGTVRIDCLRVPAMDALVGPRAHTRRDEQVDPARIARRVLLGKLQGAMHTTGLVTMHSAGHQHAGQGIVPIAAAQRQQRVAIGRIVQLAVLDHIETRPQPLDHAQHLVRITALAALARTPQCALRLAPGLTRSADWVSGWHGHLRLGLAWEWRL